MKPWLRPERDEKVPWRQIFHVPASLSVIPAILKPGSIRMKRPRPRCSPDAWIPAKRFHRRDLQTGGCRAKSAVITKPSVALNSL